MASKSPRRVPTLTIAPSAVAISHEFLLSPDTPDEYHTPLSAASSGSAPFSALVDGDEKMAHDLAILEQLRRNVQMNLQLRPLALGPDDAPPPRPPPDGPTPLPSLSPRALARRLAAPSRPLLLDTRHGGSYLASRIVGSVNIAIPSLILKRHRKPGANFPSVHPLRAYVTTERGRDIWDELMRPDGPWDRDVVVYDEEMEPHERDSAVSWILLQLLDPICRAAGRSAMYLHGGISAFRQLPDSHLCVVSGERDLDGTASDPASPVPSSRRGLSALDISRTHDAAPLARIDPDTPHSPAPAPAAVPPTTSAAVAPTHSALTDPSPSPPPPPPSSRPRKPSVPNLRRIDTASAERLPKLSLRTQPPVPLPTRSHTLSVPPSTSFPRSPTIITTSSTFTSPAPSPSPGPDDQVFYTPSSAFFTSPSPGPSTPRPHSPQTARPPPTTPTTSDIPAFAISCILPNFLFLGPELTSQENVRELHDLGVKRILNLAAECDPDDHGLDLRSSFERYVKIAMRDTVEEENIGRGVREVCECLDDARLHSSPTYVHCKAGKSRSVTAVMAYLIHANHWTLSRAYAFVLSRRKGISPNIGFVSELMNFEEQELGGKSVGVVKGGEEEDGFAGYAGYAGAGYGAYRAGGQHGRTGNYAHAAGMRRAAHMRESLPPAFNSDMSLSLLSSPSSPTKTSSSSNPSSSLNSSTGGANPNSSNPIASSSSAHLQAHAHALARVGDHAQELEVKDSSGRYRHQRRAPVDENTLQPLRRVSKAGLESGWT